MRSQNANPDLPKSNPRPVFALVFIALFLFIQISVPVVRLLSPRPARFGWHMWTVPPRGIDVDLLMRDGSSKSADLRPYVAQGRGELNLEHVLPPHLCRMMPDVAAVRYRSHPAVAAQTHTCP